MKSLKYFFLLAFITGCASKPGAEAPAWTHQTTRTVDAGYIVYVGVGEDKTLEKANFKSESVAMIDLANECSFVPKGARIEDRYDEVTPEGGHRSFAKIGITFEECESAKNALEPEAIKKIANAQMTEQIKKYQDVYYAEPDEEEKPAETAVAQNTAPPAASGGPRWAFYRPIYGYDDYFIARQQVVYLKQDVILAPPTAYVANSTESTRFASQVRPQAAEVQKFEVAHPETRTSPKAWSAVQSSPAIRTAVPHQRPNGAPARFSNRPNQSAVKQDHRDANPPPTIQKRRRRRRH